MINNYLLITLLTIGINDIIYDEAINKKILNMKNKIKNYLNEIKNGKFISKQEFEIKANKE